MGCDIHVYVEYKLQRGLGSGEARWWSGIIRNPYMPRDYQLFNRLAGVRGETAPLVPLRGFPIDSHHTDAWDDFHDGNGVAELDWHSATWLTPTEFANAVDGVINPDIVYQAVLALCRTLEREYEVRLIMWFDN